MLDEPTKKFVREEVVRIVNAIEKLTNEVKKLKPSPGHGRKIKGER
jgi:hypothetical protein